MDVSKAPLGHRASCNPMRWVSRLLSNNNEYEEPCIPRVRIGDTVTFEELCHWREGRLKIFYKNVPVCLKIGLFYPKKDSNCLITIQGTKCEGYFSKIILKPPFLRDFNNVARAVIWTWSDFCHIGFSFTLRFV